MLLIEKINLFYYNDLYRIPSGQPQVRRIQMRYRKTLQELTIKDNFMFGAVMTDEEICKDFLEMVLGFKIAQLTVSIQEQIMICYQILM